MVSDTRLFRLAGGQSRDPAVEAWLRADSHPLRERARSWFNALRSQGGDVIELLHDGHPTACVGDLPFAYVNLFATHLNVGFYFGAVLPDPSRILSGNGRFMRHVKISLGDTANDAPLHALLAAAYEDVRARHAAQKQTNPE
ncbi:hypothetical protein C7S18_19700 [Ahniella affigens]|uniref:PH domain-containing protein n=1 Tax=Ahniella affigens TaxID=2021234 RepID=A0A2P1PWL7_9GAMM|nr:DUF1801 domain-containing protein [Ahniella affigens]AVP99251.1 hypothetical protein C7S18_19700 [Ahniella affigens]